MISSTLLSRLVDMGSWCYTIAILHPVPGACLMNSLTCLERSHKTDLLWAKANASPKTQNTTVEQSLRSDTSNSRSSEYILYSYTTRFNLAVWRGSLVEAKYTDLYKFSRLSKTPARSTLFQADFDIVMYVNYNILYLRSCIYCMYLSIGVAMGNWDFSCTSNKGWPGILIETISFAIFSHFGLFGLHVLPVLHSPCLISMPERDLHLTSWSWTSLSWTALAFGCFWHAADHWRFATVSRPMNEHLQEDQFLDQTASQNVCNCISSIQFKSIFSGILEAVYSLSLSLSLHLPKVRNWTCQVSKCAVSKWMH